MRTTLLEYAADRLDNSLAKRKRELADMRFLCSEVAGRRGQMLRRSGHVMAYAHWEGFVKDCISEYLTYLKRTSQPVALLQPGLQAITFLPLLKKNFDGGEVYRAMEVMSQVGSMSSRCFECDVESVVKTGNLDSKRLKQLLSITSLGYLDEYKTREKFIDEVLCGRRHRIAHGDFQPIEWDDLEEAIDGCLELCGCVNDQVVEAMLEKMFLSQ